MTKYNIVYIHYTLHQISRFCLIFGGGATLGLRCCTRAFSSHGEQGLLFIVVCGLLIVVASLVAEHGLQACGLQQLWLAGSRVQTQYLWHTGLVAPRHVGSSWTKARIRVPYVGRWILNHCATREAPLGLILLLSASLYT